MNDYRVDAYNIKKLINGDYPISVIRWQEVVELEELELYQIDGNDKSCRKNIIENSVKNFILIVREKLTNLVVRYNGSKASIAENSEILSDEEGQLKEKEGDFKNNDAEKSTNRLTDVLSHIPGISSWLSKRTEYNSEKNTIINKESLESKITEKPKTNVLNAKIESLTKEKSTMVR